MDVEEYLACMDLMPVCSACGAVNSGNITCRTCRQANREAYQRHGWPTDHLDRLDEINPSFVKPLDVGDVQKFIKRMAGQ